MQARLIAYPPDAAALTRWLEPGERLRIGRGHDCGLVLDHPSVSRAHAELYHDGEAWRLRDLGSKNGSYADGIEVRDDRLPATCWLRLGDSYCEFAVFDPAQASALRDRQAERRALSQAMTRQISRQTNSDSLPEQVLRGVIELSGCSRGFLLLADDATDDFIVRASLQLDPHKLDTRAFTGSVGAVQRALASGRPVVVNDVGSEAWLAARASVIAGDLQTLLCLPLSDGHRVFGAVYADRSGLPEGNRAAPITDFDLELLGAFAESATLYLLARRAMQSLDAAPRWNNIVAAQEREGAAL